MSESNNMEPNVCPVCPSGYFIKDIQMEFPKFKCSACTHKIYDSDEGLMFCAFFSGGSNSGSVTNLCERRDEV